MEERYTEDMRRKEGIHYLWKGCFEVKKIKIPLSVRDNGSTFSINQEQTTKAATLQYVKKRNLITCL